MQDGKQPTRGLTRREALRRGAIVGGTTVWAVPAVQRIGMGVALGQDNGSPPPLEEGTGAVTGQVQHARTGAPIGGALVQIAGQSATTGADGTFSFLDVPAGNRTLQGSHPDFSSASVPVVVPEGGTVVQNLVLSPLGDVTVVLTWGLAPRDLDLHLSGPDGASDRFHVAWFDRNPVPHASLDRDDVDSFGPETIAITISPVTGAYVPGEYRTWVHNFSGEATFAVSAGRVVLTGRDTQVGEFLASSATGDSSLRIWRVVDFTLDAAGNMSNVQVRQLFTTGATNTVF